MSKFWLLRPLVQSPQWGLLGLSIACSGPEDTSPTATQSATTQAVAMGSTTVGTAAVTGTGGASNVNATSTTAPSTTGVATTTTGALTGATSTGAVTTTASATTSAGGGTGTTGAGTTGGVSVSELQLSAVAGNGTVGLEWPIIEGAIGYNLYWSTTPGVTPTSGTSIAGAPRGYVHRALTNDQPYYYVVTAILPEGESVPSLEVTATPTGEWVLEQLGTGDFDDVVSGARVASVPVEQRFHILLVGEGYTSSDLAVFHDHTDHDATRENDVDRWVDLVFGIEPYSLFPEAFVVWYLARPSATNIRAASPDTAFDVPLTISGSLPQMASPQSGGPTSQELFSALALHPYAPTGAEGTLRNFATSFLIFDPDRGQASVSGLSTTLTDPNGGSLRMNTAFGLGHAHEFSHAFASLRDEYLENDNSAPNNWSETSNVVGTNSCSELPWAHLLAGTSINPDTAELVGAFGTPAIGYHSELLCLLNGTHDNGEYYASAGGACQASSCTLRVEDRMCNFCREIAAYRIFARSGILANDTSGFETWKVDYRTAFYQRFGLSVPDLVPQSNDVRNPEQGMPIFEACVP